MAELQNQQIVLAKRPEGLPTEDTFEYRDIPVGEPGEGEVLVKTLYMSVDPYMRGRMSTAKSYVEPYELNRPITGSIIGEVISSRSAQFQVGDKVQGTLDWQRYNVVHEKFLRKLDDSRIPLTAYMSVLGGTGLTAYVGLLDIGQPREGETVVVSAAAGAVGSIVGQIAKMKGTRVVGIAGSDEKVAFIEQELGFDKGINYKKDGWEKELEEACPDGVDVYFENVGGPISYAVIQLLNNFARIPLCGVISAYNEKDGVTIGPSILPKILKTRSLIKGFILGDYADRLDEARRHLTQWVLEGKIKYRETIIEGFENVPKAFLGLFEGTNIGKQIVKVSEPS